MAQSPVIYVLKRKRAVISGELRKAEDRCAAMRQHLPSLPSGWHKSAFGKLSGT